MSDFRYRRPRPLAVILIIISLLVSTSMAESLSHAREGGSAPSFELEKIDGGKYRFEPGGAPSLLFFFSAFCPDCRELAPEVVRLSKKLGGKFKLVSINVDGVRFSNAVESFVAEIDLPSPVVYDEIKNDLFVAADSYGVSQTPTLIVINAAGKICNKLVAGEIPRLEEKMEKCTGISKVKGGLWDGSSKGFDERTRASRVD